MFELEPARDVEAALAGIFKLPPAKLLTGCRTKFLNSVAGMGCSGMVLARFLEFNSSLGRASLSPKATELDGPPFLDVEAPLHLSECTF